MPVQRSWSLQFASDEEIENLIRAAELDVGFHRHGVVPLRERVEKFVDRDRRLLFVKDGIKEPEFMSSDLLAQ